MLTRLSEPHSRPVATQKIWQPRESNPGPLGEQPGTLINRPQRRTERGSRFLQFMFGTVYPHYACRALYAVINSLHVILE
jgi:hypothetical protein